MDKISMFTRLGELPEGRKTISVPYPKWHNFYRENKSSYTQLRFYAEIDAYHEELKQKFGLLDWNFMTDYDVGKITFTDEKFALQWIIKYG